MPAQVLFCIKAANRLPPSPPFLNQHTAGPRPKNVPPPVPKKKPEAVIELTEADILEMKDIPCVPKVRIVFKDEYVAGVSATGIMGLACKGTPDWPIFTLGLDECVVGESDMDLPDGYSYYKREILNGAEMLNFVHLLNKTSIFIPARFVLYVRSLTKNVIVWKNS